MKIINHPIKRNNRDIILELMTFEKKDLKTFKS